MDHPALSSHDPIATFVSLFVYILMAMAAWETVGIRLLSGIQKLCVLVVYVALIAIGYHANAIPMTIILLTCAFCYGTFAHIILTEDGIGRIERRILLLLPLLAFAWGGYWAFLY